MKRYSYGERNYAFGQRMLTLRTRLGLTQAGLAKLLGVSRRAVSEWEAGSNYPTASHLQQLLELGVRQRVFAPRREEEEIRAWWQAAHQKVLLDEAWLAALLGRMRPPLTLLHPQSQEAARPGELPSAQRAPAPQLDWGEALDVPSFYGREQELATTFAQEQSWRELLPASVRAQVRARLAKLSPVTRQVVMASAVLGRQTTAHQLWQEAVRSGILRELASGSGHPASYGFAQELMRQAVLTELGEARRQVLSQRAAGWIERKAVKLPQRAAYALSA